MEQQKQSSIEGKIEQLQKLIQQGESAAKEAEGKSLLMVLGNTGAGKSTAINYIDGCKMVSEMDMDQGREIIQVDEKAGNPPALMKIGHDKSETLIPQIKSGKVGTYIDNPGFNDTRGAITNIANAINIKNAISKANSVKILILINFHSLFVDRMKGLNDMLTMLKELFGGNLNSSMGSISIGITHIDACGGSGYKSLEGLRKLFSSHENTKDFADRVITFDPLDNPLAGGMKRKELLNTLDNLKPIVDCKSMFNTVLLDSDKVELAEISREIAKRLKQDLEVKVASLTTENFKRSAEQFKLLKSLEVIGHNEINEHVKDNKDLIKNRLNEIFSEFREKCSRFEFDEADRIYKLLTNSLGYFDDEFKKMVDLTSLKRYRDERFMYKQNEDDKQRRLQNQLDEAQKSAKKLQEKMEYMEEKKEREQKEKDEQERKQKANEKEKEEQENKRNTSVIYCNVKSSDKCRTKFDHNVINSVDVVYGGTFYKYRVNISVKEACSLRIVDDSGDCYSLWCKYVGSHYVDYNSDGPNIRKIFIV